MNANDVIAVLCPCCEKELYRGTMGEDGNIQKSSSSPAIKDDGKGGYFMLCPHSDCQKRIVMVSVIGGASGAAFELAPNSQQPCA